MSDIAIPYDVEPHPITGMFNGKFGTWLFLASEVMLFGALFSAYVVLRVGAPPGTWPLRGDEMLNVWLAFFNTLVLITSSVTMVMAWASLKTNKLGRGRMYLLFTFLLAGIFLVVKYFEYSAKFHHDAVTLETPMVVNGVERIRVAGRLESETPDAIVFLPDARQPVFKPDARAATPAPAGTGGALHIDRSNVKRLTSYGPNHSNFLAVYFTLTGLHGLHVVGGMVVILYLILSGPKAWKNRSEKYTNRVECTGLYWHFVDLVWIFLFPVLYLL